MEVMEPPGCGRENFYVSKALEFVQTHYAYPIRVSDIANYVCINRSYLYTLFEKALHVSPQEYLANFRLTRAAELLSSTALSVESVALSSGYRDPLVFAKAFKQKTGETPSQYRQRHNQENSRKMKDIKSMDDPALSDSAIKFT
jgi:transcriptional regulator GlxA family with amidase domain